MILVRILVFTLLLATVLKAEGLEWKLEKSPFSTPARLSKPRVWTEPQLQKVRESCVVQAQLETSAGATAMLVLYQKGYWINR
jgi:hypothetical protein